MWIIPSISVDTWRFNKVGRINLEENTLSSQKVGICELLVVVKYIWNEGDPDLNLSSPWITILLVYHLCDLGQITETS